MLNAYFIQHFFVLLGSARDATDTTVALRFFLRALLFA